MGSDEFLELCKKEVRKYTEEHLDKTDGKLILMFMLFGVAKHCKIVKL